MAKLMLSGWSEGELTRGGRSSSVSAQRERSKKGKAVAAHGPPHSICSAAMDASAARPGSITGE